MDFNRLASLRLEAMRESLDAVGRFDPERSIKRFKSSFASENTTSVLVDHALVGFFSVSEKSDHLYLDHLYIDPKWQSQGVGTRILNHLIAYSDDKHLPIRVGVLKESRANAFYIKHGFQATKTTEWDTYYQR